MKDKFKLKYKQKIIIPLALSIAILVAFLSPPFLPPLYQAADPPPTGPGTSSESSSGSIRAFLLGNCSITYDYVGSDDDPLTPPDTYRFSGSGSTLSYNGNPLTSLPSKPTGNNITITYNEPITIPKQFGNYEVIEVMGAHKASINSVIDGGAPITYALMTDALKNGNKPFDWPVITGSQSIVAKGVDTKTGDTYGVNINNISQASAMTINSVFKYSATDYTPEVQTGLVDSTYKVNFRITNASLETAGNELNNMPTREWTTLDNLEVLLKDAELLKGILRDKFGSSLTDEQLMNPEYAITDYTEKQSLKDITKSNTFSYQAWLSYWNNHYLQSTQALEQTLPGIWKNDPKYVKEDGSYNGPKVMRVYYPYLIELRLKKSLNLKLVTNGEPSNRCFANFIPNEGVISIKIIGSLDMHPDGEAGKVENETVHLTVSDVTGLDTSGIENDTYDNVIGDIKLTADSPGITYHYHLPTDSFPTPPSGCTKDGKFIKFPIPDYLNSTDPTHIYKFYIRAEINTDKRPEETTYNDNVFRALVEVPPVVPDMFVESATGSFEADSESRTVPVKVNITTGSTDCDHINDKYLSGSKVEYVIKAPNGTVVKSGNYQHNPLVDKVIKDDINFDAQFTESEFVKTYQITVKINGGESGPHTAPKENPDKELTYSNNEKTFPITVRRKQKDPPPPTPTPTPSLPPYTRTYACFYIDNDQPAEDSKVLSAMGTFSDDFTSDLITPNPSPTAVWPKTEGANLGNHIAFVKEANKSDATKKLNMGKVISTYYKPVWGKDGVENGVDGWINTTQPVNWFGQTYTKSKNENDPSCHKTLNDYKTALQKCQCYATFVNWNTEKFQETKGRVKVEEFNEQPWLKLLTREVSHYETPTQHYCMNDCCEYAATTAKDVEICEAKHKHKDHTCSKTYHTTNDEGETESHTETSFIHYQQTCPLCGTHVAGGPSDVPHLHTHEEYCLVYLKSVTLQYNIVIEPLDETNTKVLDHGTAESITRSGYGYTPKIESASYLTDCNVDFTEGEADYGMYHYKHYDSSAYVRSPATNIQPAYEVYQNGRVVRKVNAEPNSGGDIYAIHLLEERDLVTEPFSKQYRASKNPQSPLNYREIFVDLDYKDTNDSYKFPVIFAIMYYAPNFQPAKDEYLELHFPKTKQLMEEYPNLEPALGICYTNTSLKLRGNMYDDTWAHPVTPDGNEGRSWAH